MSISDWHVVHYKHDKIIILDLLFKVECLKVTSDHSPVRLLSNIRHTKFEAFHSFPISCPPPFLFRHLLCLKSGLIFSFTFMNNCFELSPSRTRRLVLRNQQRAATRKRRPQGATLKGLSRLSRATPTSVCVNFFKFFYLFFHLFSPHSSQKC